MSEYQREIVGQVSCTGEAHSNAYADRCATCMDYEWGLMPVFAPIDWTRAVVEHLDVPFTIMNDGECEFAFWLINGGFADCVAARTRGAYYNVLRFRGIDGDE